MINGTRSTKVRIGEHIVFTPAIRELFNENTNLRITLQTPASHCLELLIEKTGDIVSQDEIILRGWGAKRKSAVSSNTYYQCILHLRKSLNELGLTDAVITIPRFGLRIRNNIPVTYLEDAIDNIETEERTEYKVNNLETLNSESSNKLIIHTKYSPRGVGLWPKRLSKRSNLAWLALFLINLFIVAIIVNKNHVFDFGKYLKIANGQCNTYVNDKIITAQELNSALNNLGLSCTNKTVVFAETTAINLRINMLYCTRYTLFGQNCKTIVLMKNSGGN